MSSETPPGPLPTGDVGRPDATGGPPLVLDPVEVMAGAVTAVPGVAALHGGMFGEVGTYLPGRRVAGISVGEDRTAVHVSVEWGSSVHDVAEAVRRTAAQHVAGRVDVFVEDVAPAGPGDRPA